uniref:BTB domain-containing protein n=1 Tax=Glossina palpalis gambiensis TaxID=67801 RepID=A0A1B0AT35_9MUSC
MEFNSAPSVVTVPEYWGHTKVKMIRFNYKWTIDDFSFWCKEECKILRSPTFFPDDNEELKWSFLNLEVLETSISIYLELLSGGTSSGVNAECTMSILNEAKGKKKTKILGVHQYIKGSDRGFKNFINKDYLLNVANGFLPKDKLTIFCEMCVKAEVIDISSQPQTQQFKLSAFKLNEDLGKLFDSEKYSDVTIVVGDRSFPVHKAILAGKLKKHRILSTIGYYEQARIDSRSDVFAAMFEHETIESKLNRVTINDIDPEVVIEMLRFIYTGEAPNLDRMADDLLAAADKYALDNLKVMCAKALCAKLSVETAAEILILADLHSIDQLKAQTIRFILTNATDVMETQGWQNMIKMHPHLIAEAFRGLVTKHNKQLDHQKDVHEMI